MADTIDILLLGSGGREHALLRKLKESPHPGRFWVAPGNGGMLAEAEAAPIDQDSPEEVAAFAREHGIGLVVIGPEAPLVAGVADAVRAAGLLRPLGRGGPDGGLQAVRQAGHGPRGCAHRGLAVLHRPRRLRGLRARGRRPRGREGRRPGRGQGRDCGSDHRGGPGRCGRVLRRPLRRGGRDGRRGGDARRPRMLAARPHGRHDARPPRHEPGSQARLRRRPWPQHGRHGRLLACPRGDPRAVRGHGRRRAARD